MWPRIVAFSCLFILCSSVFSQEKFTVVRDLRADWMIYDDDAYKPLAEVPLTGLKTIYFQLDPKAFAGNFLLLKSERTYFMFVNGKVAGEFEGQVLLNLDSVKAKFYRGSYWIAVHQDRINERDLQCAVVSMRPLRIADDSNPPKPYSYFRDFVVVAGLIIILLFLLLLRLQPKLAGDYFSFARIISSREADDGQANARLTSGSNVQFYIFISLLIGFYLLIIMRNLPSQYSLPNFFPSSGFWVTGWQWIKISALILLVLLIKILIIFALTRLFGLRGMARFHFFNWIRLLLLILGAGTIVLFTYFISRGERQDYFVIFLSLVVVALAAWTVMAFFKLSGRTGHSMFHLFSYLCATEIIPLLITVKVLFQ